MTYGDVLRHKYIVMNLLESVADYCIAVDSDWLFSRNKGRYADLVHCTRAYDKMNFSQPAYLVKAFGKEWQENHSEQIHGEFMGLLKLSAPGAQRLHALFGRVAENDLRAMRITELLNRLVSMGEKVEVIYTRGHWLDVDEVQDVTDPGIYGTAAR
jgi:phosphoenolpyruvate phosphomutase